MLSFLPRRSSSFFTILCILTCLAFASALPGAEKKSVREDPDLKDFHAIDDLLRATPKPPPIQKTPKPEEFLKIPSVEAPAKKPAPKPSTREALESNPALLFIPSEGDKRSVHGVSPKSAQSGPPTKTGSKTQIVKLIDQIPICAVLDLEFGETVNPANADALSQWVWNEVNRTKHSRLQRLPNTRQILASQGLTPDKPYQIPPSPQHLAAVLQVDFLYTGNVNQVEDLAVLELMLYSASTNSIVRSLVAMSSTGLEGLVAEIPKLVTGLQEVIPKRILGASSTLAADDMERRKLLAQEIAQLRLENDNLRNQLRSVEDVAQNIEDKDARASILAALEKSEGVVEYQPGVENGMTPSPPPIPNGPDGTNNSSETEKPFVPEKLPPVRHGNKSAKRNMKTFSTATHAPRPTPVVTATPQPTPVLPVVTPKPKATPTPPPTPVPTPTPPPTPKPTPTPEKPNTKPTPAPTPTPSTPVTTPSSEDALKKAKEHFDAADSQPDDSRAAVESLREALRLDPNNPEYQYQFIVRLYNTGQNSECARRGSEFARRPKAHSNIALYAAAAFKDLKDYKSALSLMDDLLKKQPTNNFALFNRALYLKELGRPEAIAAYEHYLKSAANDSSQIPWIPEAEKNLEQLKKSNQ